MNPEIIHEDKSLMVLNKPAGWITNDSASVGERSTIQKWLAANFDFETVGIREYRDGIVHRLDKETSGVLLIAKTKETFENLQAQFKNRVVRKKYVALVHGELEPAEGRIDITVGRLPWRRDRFGVLPGGRESVTEYKAIGSYKLEISNEIFTLVELSPKTGRTHQIRIHMKFLTHPIVSDEFYAGRKTAKRDRTWCPRLFLHASEIEFMHPSSDKKVNFEARLPHDLEKALASLSKSSTFLGTPKP